jgi:predicted CopG family antitoxin
MQIAIDILNYYTYNIRVRRPRMQKKLTVTIDEEVYKGLHNTIGPRKISKFIEELVRPHVTRPNLESAYKAMARDRAREKEALEWTENTFKDIACEKM